MMQVEWTEKYRPKTLSEVTGNSKAIAELKKWAEEWKKDKKAAILYGPPGIGKTSAVYALANDMGWSTIELNASDQRTADIIKKVAGTAAITGTFEGTKGRRLIILDEADNIHGNADRGGTRAIGEVIKNANQPIVLIANEYYDMSKALRGLCKSIQFRAVQSKTVVPLLGKICHQEGIDCDINTLEAIATNAPDFRSAINDLQALSQGRKKVTIDDISVGIRDTKESIFKVLAKIFKDNTPKEVRSAVYTLDESPEDFIHWLDENLPKEYEGKDLADGFECLSRADVFLGRVRRRQNYGMWRYANDMMVNGIQAAKSQAHYKFVPYQPPSTWRKLGRAKSARAIRDSVAAKIGKHCHVSQRYARSDLISFFKILFRDVEHAARISALLDLKPEEIAFLLDAKPDNEGVKKVFDAAGIRIEEGRSK
ncbi:MAG: replication factor C large subunit [Methanosarcinales archaeon]|nr:MAG: replication factor C large subunit [Methanosarcinales archaeon]